MQFPAIVLTNRKDLYLPAALESLAHLNIARTVIVDDTGDEDWRRSLRDSTGNRVVGVAAQPAGYANAMQAVWDAAWMLRSPYVFLLEEDFTIDQDVDLGLLADVINENPRIAQVALQRQPWYENEKKHGLIGAMRENGVTFTERDGTWLEHDAGFTGNPSLINREVLIDLPRWPTGDWTESQMGKRMKARRWTFGYWGLEGQQTCTHHGHERAETSKGY